jgi:hypothetical protein
MSPASREEVTLKLASSSLDLKPKKDVQPPGRLRGRQTPSAKKLAWKRCGGCLQMRVQDSELLTVAQF